MTYKYFSEIWFFSLRDKHKLTIFEPKIPRKVFEPKKAEITRDQRKLRNDLLNDFDSLKDFTGGMRSSRTRVGKVISVEEKRNVCRLLGWKPEGKQ
jgi:hypothetical protein